MGLERPRSPFLKLCLSLPFEAERGGIVYVSLNQTRARRDFTALRGTQDAA